MSESATISTSPSKETQSEIILPEMNTPNESNNLSFPNDAASTINSEEDIVNKIKDFYSQS